MNMLIHCGVMCMTLKMVDEPWTRWSPDEDVPSSPVCPPVICQKDELHFIPYNRTFQFKTIPKCDATSIQEPWEIHFVCFFLQ